MHPYETNFRGKVFPYLPFSLAVESVKLSVFLFAPRFQLQTPIRIPVLCYPHAFLKHFFLHFQFHPLTDMVLRFPYLLMLYVLFFLPFPLLSYIQAQEFLSAHLPLLYAQSCKIVFLFPSKIYITLQVCLLLLYLCFLFRLHLKLLPLYQVLYCLLYHAVALRYLRKTNYC